MVGRAGEPQLMAVEMEAAEGAARGLELMVGGGYRIKIEARFCELKATRRKDWYRQEIVESDAEKSCN